MILVELNFGRGVSLEKAEMEDIAESYLASLFHYGQLCGEYFLTWIKGQLICPPGMRMNDINLMEANQFAQDFDTVDHTRLGPGRRAE